MSARARPRLLVPGLVPRDPARERHRVRRGAATVLSLEPDDRLTVRDLDGGQRAEVTVVGPMGDAFEGLGLTPDGAATVLRSLAGAPDSDAQQVVSTVAARGVDPTRATAAVLFGPTAPSGSVVVLRAERPGLLVVVGAPADADSVLEGGLPASDLELEVARARPLPELERSLPEPLAQPRLDFQVDRASALAYEVKAGEYIQVIDVQGRQCSDFLAFNTGKLDRGKERGLDSTATRSLMGSAYPRPGLYSKFFDSDLEPLVEVVRDTVGRHDTFGLACTRKYYEDMGYFGHVNCSDNFNEELTPYAIEPRGGWPAINFFFNTAFDADNLYVVDEPWSRPGDYVLLRASTDLVCLSSACPDDIDAANAWNPTEVHVRVYPASERFSAAIAHRVTPDAEPKLTKETGFHTRTSALTSRFTDYNGYWLPTAYDNHGAVDEYWACRERAAIMDLSPLRKFEVLGPDALALLQATVTRDVARLADGQVVYTAMCNETGGMLDDGTVFRLAADNFRWVGGSEYGGIWLREQAERLGLRVWVKESTDDLHNVAVQGPLSREILAGLVWTAPAQTPFAELTWFRFAVARLRRPHRRAAHRFAHGLHGRARLRALLPPEGRCDVVGPGRGGRRATRPHASRPRGARHGPDRGRPDLRGLGVRRPGRPVRGGNRLHGARRQGGRLRRCAGARRAARAPAAHARRARAGGQRDGRSRRLRARGALAGRRDHVGDALAGAEEEHRPLPDGDPVRRARHRGRGREARRAPEEDSCDRRPHPVLRPRQDAAALVTPARNLWRDWHRVGTFPLDRNRYLTPGLGTRHVRPWR